MATMSMESLASELSNCYDPVVVVVLGDGSHKSSDILLPAFEIPVYVAVETGEVIKEFRPEIIEAPLCPFKGEVFHPPKR